MTPLLAQGGPVLWLILAIHLLSIFLIVHRALFVHRSSLRGRDFLSGILTNLRRGHVMEAVALCDEMPGPIPLMARAAILERQKGGREVRQIMREVGIVEIARLEKNLPLILALAQLGPVLGLLGTAVGMWEMLNVLDVQAPMVHAGDLAAGLRKALVTTVAGLGTGAIAYFGYSFLVGRINAVVLEMERAYLEIAQELEQPAVGPAAVEGASSGGSETARQTVSAGVT